MKLITVFKGFNPTDAQMIRARLEAADFHPVVNNELPALTMGSVSVEVPEDEADDAKKFLDTPAAPAE